MRYYLMHKDVFVAELSIDEHTGTISRVLNLAAPEHLPIGIYVKDGIVDRASLNQWWLDRSIPASRSGIKAALETLNIPNTKVLLTKCFGLSLSDQYWVKPENTELSWKDVNFFDNSFTEDIGDVLLGKADKKADFDFRSPDNTSDGCLKKRWKIIDGKRCLIKGGSMPFMQQPFSEVIASSVMRRLGIAHVPYTLMWDKGKPYSVCEDFVTTDTELVSAWRVMQTQKRDNNTSPYRHYVNCCTALGVNDIVQSLDQMIVLDYIIANEDRHLNNFGLIRNADTLEFISAAPIFDSGSSLGFDKLAQQIRHNREIECKPFKSKHQEQLMLVTSFDWVDFQRLNGIDDEINEILSSAGEYADDARTEAIIYSVMSRIRMLKSMADKTIK